MPTDLYFGYFFSIFSPGGGKMVSRSCFENRWYQSRPKYHWKLVWKMVYLYSQRCEISLHFNISVKKQAWCAVLFIHYNKLDARQSDFHIINLVAMTGFLFFILSCLSQKNRVKEWIVRFVCAILFHASIQNNYSN